MPFLERAILARNVRRLRLASGLSTDELAKLCECGRRTLVRLEEEAGGEPRIGVVVNVAEALSAFLPAPVTVDGLLKMKPREEGEIR